MTGIAEPKDRVNHYKNTNNKTESLKTPNAECKHVRYYEPVVK